MFIILGMALIAFGAQVDKIKSDIAILWLLIGISLLAVGFISAAAPELWAA